MEYMKIGQGLEFKEDLVVTAALSGSEKLIKKGDKGIVTRKIREGQAEVKVTTGAANGKLLIIEGSISDDYDVEAIARRLALRITREFLDSDEDIQKEIQDLIEASLDDYYL